jgi:hypothetical protein
MSSIFLQDKTLNNPDINNWFVISLQVVIASMRHIDNKICMVGGRIRQKIVVISMIAFEFVAQSLHL